MPGKQIRVGKTWQIERIVKANSDTQRISEFDVFDDPPGEIRMSTVDAGIQDSDCYTTPVTGRFEFSVVISVSCHARSTPVADRLQAHS